MMVHSIGAISGIIVMFIIIMIMNHNSIMSTIIAMMMVIIVMTINANCHYSSCPEIRRVILVIVRRIIRHIHRGINVLYNRG